jgi:hypothetical protein
MEYDFININGTYEIVFVKSIVNVFKLAKVAKTDMTWPFYVKHHINIHLHALVAFIMTKTPK